MPVGITALAEYDDDHLPAAPEVSVPSRKQPGGVNASASSDDIRISNDLRQLVSMSRQQIWMSLLKVFFALLGELYLRAKPRATETAHGSGVGHLSWLPWMPGAANASKLIRSTR